MKKRIQLLVFLSLVGASVLFWWHSLAVTFRLALVNDAYTNILLILPLSMALIYLEWRHPELRTHPGHARPNWRLGAVLLAGAALLGCYSRWGLISMPSDLRTSLAMFSLVSWWIASVVACFGVTTFRSILFPLCFLFWMVPLPTAALGWVVEFLQQQSATAARIMFHLSGVPAVQDGIVLSIPGMDIEVAPECSSIRSSLMLVITTIVLARLLLRSWWRRVLLVACAVPLSIAKNAFRIVVISELGTRVDPGFFGGNLHHHGGILFLALALGMTILLLWLLRRTESAAWHSARVR